MKSPAEIRAEMVEAIALSIFKIDFSDEASPPHWLDEKWRIYRSPVIHCGDCTNEPHTCVKCESERFLSYGAAAIAALSSMIANAGLKLVPVEPEQKMWVAGGDAVVGRTRRHHDRVVSDVWNAMLAAFPDVLAPAKGDS